MNRSLFFQAAPAIIIFLISALSPVQAETKRTFTPTPGFIKAEDLPKEFSAMADSIYAKRMDAFEGSISHSPVEDEMFTIGNLLHIKSIPATIHRRLLFKKGERVTRDLLLETERRLRKELFLADAIIEVSDSDQDTVTLIIHTYDQWTTVIPASLNRSGGKWVYWFGLTEGNILGTGQKTGIFYSHGLDRDSYYASYSNNTFIFNNIQLSGLGGKASDGYFYEYSLSQPLLSKQQKWGFSFSGKGNKSEKYYYLDADRKQEALTLVPGYRDAVFTPVPDNANRLFIQPEIVELSAFSSLTRSWGRKHKLNVSVFHDWRENYQDGKADDLLIVTGGYDSTTLRRFTSVPEQVRIDFRNDQLIGLQLNYFWSEYKMVKNFRNLKWNEDLDVGYRLTNSVSKNVEALGAKNSDFNLSHTLVYVNAWQSRYFLNTSLTSSYFLGTDGTFEDGSLAHQFEYQWKPLSVTSTFFSSQWQHYFKKEPSAQWWLGEENGLNAYPNRFFAGQARVLMEMEQRYFPDFEFGTLLPALAAFVNAGNVFDEYDDFRWGELHYAAGLGLRLGASRSAQKVVNHINISMPLDSKYRDVLGWSLSILAKQNL